MTQADLAKKCRVTQTYVSKLERTPQNLTLDQLELIARALGVPPVALLASQKDAAKLDAHEKELVRDKVNELMLVLETFRDGI